MKVNVIGATAGEYQGNAYGRIYSLEPFQGSHGIGVKPVIFKTSLECAKMIDEVDIMYNLEFNQYGKVVEVTKLSES